MDENHKGRCRSRSAFFRASRAARKDKIATRCQCAASGLSRDGLLFRSCRALSHYAPATRLLMNALQAAFAAYPRHRKSLMAAVFHGRPDPLPDATNRQRAAGNGIAVMPPAGC
ncbi:hypothetical protein NN677_004794 [Salmonella enterica]|nr:hypothetical protein [Salmonella enterica]EJM2521269.1 hypothetical protein [Salmonella enterica]